MGAGLARGHRRARLPALARAPALGFIGMLMGWWRVVDLLRLPVSHLTWGRRSRKRGDDDARRARRRSPRARGEPAAPPRRRPRLASARPAPWGSFPLSELVILLGHRPDGLGLPQRRRRRGERVAAGLVIASLGGGELALREHLAGYRSHSACSPASAAFVAVTALALGARPGQGLGPGGGRGRRLRRYVLLDARAVQAPLRRARLPELPADERAARLRIAGSTTSRCSAGRGALDRLLPQPARHAARRSRPSTATTAARATSSSATSRARPGTLVTCLEYPDLDEGIVGPRLDPPLRARGRVARRSSRAWHDYLRLAGVALHRGDGPHLLQVDLPARPGRPHRGAGHRGPGLPLPT